MYEIERASLTRGRTPFHQSADATLLSIICGVVFTSFRLYSSSLIARAQYATMFGERLRPYSEDTLKSRSVRAQATWPRYLDSFLRSRYLKTIVKTRRQLSKCWARSLSEHSRVSWPKRMNKEALSKAVSLLCRLNFERSFSCSRNSCAILQTRLLRAR